jgi:hypothetical protein
MGGAGACAVFALVSHRLRTPVRRFACVGLAGACVLAAVAVSYPQCLGDPFVGLDPLVREIWLANNTEIRSIPKVLSIYPTAWPMLLLPPLAGLAALIAAVVCERGETRARFIVVTALAAVGCATAFWAIRASASLGPIALMGGVWAATRLSAKLRHRGLAAFARPIGLLACLPFSPLAWAIVTPTLHNPAEEQRLRGGETCRAASAYAPLAALPAGRVFAPMDAGSHLLVHTPHSAFGAPYHRNNRGNRLVIDGLLAPPDAARDLIMASGADYVALCPGQTQVDVIAKRSPDGLAAQLLAGHVPDWLVALDLPHTPYQVYRVRR